MISACTAISVRELYVLQYVNGHAAVLEIICAFKNLVCWTYCFEGAIYYYKHWKYHLKCMTLYAACSR